MRSLGPWINLLRFLLIFFEGVEARDDLFLVVEDAFLVGVYPGHNLGFLLVGAEELEVEDAEDRDCGKRAGEDRKSRSKKPARFKDRRPPKPKYRPKSRPKPVVPITDGMKAGTEAMRTFGDLAQFFQLKQEEAAEAEKDAGKETEDKKQDADSNDTK